MSKFVLPLGESKMLLTMKLKPWSKYLNMPWSELYGLVVEVEHCGDFKVTGIEDLQTPGKDAYTRTLTVRQL